MTILECKCNGFPVLVMFSKSILAEAWPSERRTTSCSGLLTCVCVCVCVRVYVVLSGCVCFVLPLKLCTRGRFLVCVGGLFEFERTHLVFSTHTQWEAAVSFSSERFSSPKTLPSKYPQDVDLSHPPTRPRPPSLSLPLPLSPSFSLSLSLSLSLFL